MIKRLWMKFLFLLLAVSVIALSAAFMLRELLVSDFREYLEGEKEDRVYWITAALESSFETVPGWDRQQLIEDTVWALMLGFEIKLYDTDETLIIDTDSAINTLSPLIKKRISAIMEHRDLQEKGGFLPYALFLGGTEIGHLEVRFLRPKRENVFIERSNRFLAFSLVVLGSMALLFSIIFSRRLTNPIEELTDAVTAIERGNLKSRVIMAGSDEISKLSHAFNRMAKTLEIQESLRKKLASNIAHELRTPISIIRGELEGMMDGLIPVDRENIQALHDEMGRLRNIIEGLEELAQAEASVLTLSKSRFELSPFLENIIGRYGKMYENKGVTLDLQCDDGLIIHADPERLSQIVINLLSNALKATEKGGNVRVRAEGSFAGANIHVIDDGRGIKQVDLPFIFERFYRASEGGLGLGLAIVKELVEAHGGSIEARSEFGQGSSFIVSLPSE